MIWAMKRSSYTATSKEILKNWVQKKSTKISTKTITIFHVFETVTIPTGVSLFQMEKKLLYGRAKPHFTDNINFINNLINNV